MSVDSFARALALQSAGGTVISLTVASTRAGVASSPTSQGTVFLSESGREGAFTWEAGNFSAQVTADSAQGIFIASSSDPSGVTGAWVRQFTGPAESTWFGVATTATDANNTAAFTAALAALKAIRIIGFGHNDGSIGLHTPAGVYQFNNTLNIQHALEISGDYVNSGGGTVFQWTSATHGFQGLSTACNGARIRGFMLIGTGGGSAIHAINQTGNLKVYDVFGKTWSGDCVHADSASGGLSGSEWRNITAEGVGWTLYINGADSNGCANHNIGASTNRFGAVFDGSGIGCLFVGGICNSAGLVSGFVTRCVSGTHVYMVGYGQESWCSTNAPSGTTASNQGWWYLSEGSASATQPAWTTGQTWYFSSPYCSRPTDGNVRSAFVGVYAESGLNALVISDLSNVFNGQILVPVYNQFGTKHGGYISASRYYAIFNNALQTNGPATNFFNNPTSQFGPSAAPASAQDLDIELWHWNAINKFTFVGNGTFSGQLLNTGFQMFYDFDTHTFRTHTGSGGTLLAALSTSGFIASVALLANKLGGVGYATGAGGSVTQATSKTTAVTLNKDCGQIITSNSALAAGAVATFIVNTTEVVNTDTVVLSLQSGMATFGTYRYWVEAVLNGFFRVTIENRSAGSLSEALTFNFAIIKSVNA